jgi:biotin--protein ligase
MNVFIYAGPEVVQRSLTRTLAALKLVLVPNYTVQSITPQSLKSHPWSPNCALLLFPECHHLDLPDPRVVDNIRTYIEQGGRAIFLKALLRKSQTYLNAKGLHFTDRQQGPTGHLVLYPCGTPSERTVRRIQSTTTNRYFSVFASSRSVVDVLQPPTDTPLASYTDSGDSAHVPGVVCNVSRGKIAVWSHDMTEAKEPHSVDDDAEHVLALLKDTVVALGMNVVMESAVHRSIPRPKPQLLVSRPAARGIIAHVLDGLSIKIATDIGPVEFEDSNDRFRFSYQSPTVEQLPHDSDLYSQDDPTSWQPKHILVYPDGMLPADSSTPLFSLTDFFGKLEAPIPTSSASWAIGDVVLYGETVTSTQTMLDRRVMVEA